MDNNRLVELGVLQVCRACLTDEGNMKSVFGCESQDQEPLYRKIEMISSIEIAEDDGLPGLLCDKCEMKLNFAFEFRQQCHNSYSKLKKYIDNVLMNIKKEESPEVEEITQLKIEPTMVHELSVVDSGSSEEEELQRPEKNGGGKCLEQFTDEDVNRAIVESKQKHQEKRECRLCGFQASNARGLSLHISHLHKELKERWCGICYEEVDQLSEHLQQHARTKAHVCALCGKGFGSQGHLTEHVRGHSSDRPHKCQVCAKGFLSARHLRVHERTHSGERPYICPHCGRSFTQNGSLQGHIRTHTGHKPFRCGTCDKTCTTSSALASHRLKTGHVTQPCELVTTNTTTVESERQEELITEAPQKLEQHREKLCTACGKTFKTASKLRLHTRIHTGETPYRCTHCEKRFSTRGQLVVHERTHTGERPHVCHVCGKGFAQSSVLGTHLRLHTGRPEQCSVCGRRFCRPAELRLHMRRHTGEKPYLCTQCGQAFVQRSHLMEHVKIHSDERPYKCTVCGRAFKQSSSLKSHVQIHTGHKPYRCSQCPYACRQSYALTQHMRQHQVDRPRDDRPHQCEVCHRAFTTRAMLDSHARSAHAALFPPTEQCSPVQHPTT